MENNMATLLHEGQAIQTTRDGFSTQVRGSNDQEYQIYLSFSDNGKGIDITTGKPLKTYEQWLAS